MKLLVAAALALASACTVHSQGTSATDNVSAVAENAAHRSELPGIAVAVVRDGRIVGQAVQGLANVEAAEAVTAQTPFQVASTTKPFTATGVMLLVGDGRLRLDDQIGNLLDDLPAAWRAVTVRQLLSHTSGLPDIARVPGQLDLIADNWDEAFRLIRNAPMQFEPGERWAYTQTNYVLLTHIIERLSGMPFERFMQARVFGPLGLQNTFFPTGETGSRTCATNYEKNASGQRVRRDLSFPNYVHGAGGLCTSLEDMIHWNGALDSGRLLPAALSQAMWSPVTLNSGARASPNDGAAGYGLGWAIDTTAGRVSVGHSGGNSTAFRRYEDQHMTVIVLHNGVADPDAIVMALAESVLNPNAASNPQNQLWDAAGAGDVRQVESALSAGADVNALDTRTSRNGRRALNWAAIGNHVDVIELLLARGAHINGVNRTGFTALHHAAEAGSLEASQALLAAGADPTLRTQGGALAVEIARENNHAALADLIEHRAARSN